MRVVLDTNVLLAGIATHGLCEAVVAICFRDHSVVISDHILNELAEHYIDKFKASAEQAAAVVRTFRKQCQVVVPAYVLPDACDDADDLPVLGTAAAGQAECLVTGDKQLLDLGKYGEIPILAPRQFYELFCACE